MSLRRFKAGLLPVGGVSILLSGALIVIAVGALKTYRRSMIRVMEKEGIALMDAIKSAARNSIEAQKVVGDLLSERLLGNATLIDRLGTLSPELLAYIAHINGLLGIDVVDERGRVIISSKGSGKLAFPLEILDPVLKEEKDQWAFVSPDSTMLGVALRREWGKGIILIYADLQREESVLASIGLGPLIRKMGREPQMVYVALQDREGILYATENVKELNKITEDDWIKRAIEENRTRARRTYFEGEEVLEVVSPFFDKGQLLGVFRLGLSMKGYHAILKAGSQQLVLLSIVLLLLVFLLGILWIGNQSVLRLERTYEENKRAFEEVLGKLPVGVILVDENLRVRGINHNALEILGIRDVPIGKPFKDTVDGDPFFFERTFRERRPIRRSRVHYRDREGNLRILQVYTSPILEEMEKVKGAVSVVEDITENVMMEDRLTELEKLETLGEMAASVAHDIRNPLNSIGIATQRLIQEAGERLSEEEKKLLEQTKREIFRLEETLSRFLSMTTPLKLRLQEEDLNRIVREVVEVFRPQAESQGIKIRFDLEDGLEPLKVDRDRVKEALSNLVKNAIEAMPKGGELTLTTLSKQGGIEVRVKDTGPGISEDDLSHIFRPYFSRKKGGTGMGLTSAYRIALLHGGNLSVESRPNEGTTFILFLPHEKDTHS